MSWITYLTNCSAILVIIYHFLKLKKSNTVESSKIRPLKKVNEITSKKSKIVASPPPPPPPPPPPKK